MLCHMIRLYEMYTLMERLIMRVFITILWQATIIILSTSIGFAKSFRQGIIINWIQAVFGLSKFTITLHRSLAWKYNLKYVMNKVIPKMIGPQTPTPKKVVMMLMVKWLCLMWKLLILLGMIHHKSLCTIVTRKTLQPNYFIFRNFQKVQVYIIFLLNKPSCFILRRAKMWLMQSRTKQFFYFVLANIIVPIEDILDMNNVGDMLT